MGVSFDTVDDSLVCGSANNVMLDTTSISISVWIYPKVDQVGGGDPRICARGGCHFSITATSSFYFEVAGIQALDKFAGNNYLVLNSWQQVGMIWTGGSSSATDIKLYYQGTETTYRAGLDLISITNNSGTVFTIGNTSNFSRPEGGYIDELAVWNTNISSADMFTLGKARVKGLPMRISTANLLSYWPLDDIADGSSGDGVSFRDRQGTTTATGSDGTNNTGCLGTNFKKISYLWAIDKNKGLGRGLIGGSFP